MAHLTDGTLRRMVDDPDAKAGADGAHLDGCAGCQARFESISADARSIATLLAVPTAHIDVDRAFARVTAVPHGQPRFGFRLPVGQPSRRPYVLALAAAVVGVALIGTAVAANPWKTNYSPTTIQTVPVTVADMQALSELANYGTISWTTQPNLQAATSAVDAAAAAEGMQAPVVKTLPDGVSTNITYGAMPKAQAVFTFSAERARSSAAAHGKPLPALPAGMDGAQLTVTVGPAVGEIYGDLNQRPGSDPNVINLPRLIVVKSASPKVTSTQVSVQQMESYILAQPGISPQLAKAIKAIKNPDRTLVIPLPVEFATSTTVHLSKQGVDAVALGDNTGVGSGVVWMKNGIVYAVGGSIPLTQAEDIANNLQ